MGTNSLPAFSYDWVGGDISGLQALEGQCNRVASQIDDADHALVHRVSSIVGAGNWTGKAADAFTSAWDRDSKAGAQLADIWLKIGKISSTLAADLAALESALEEAAYRLEKQGVPVDPATGLPMPNATANGKACPSPQTAAVHAKLADEYMSYREGVLKQATAARTHATNVLYSVTTELLPNQFDYGQLTNDLDGIRGLWALPTQVRLDFEKAEGAKGAIDAKAWGELLAKRKVSGDNARLEKSTIEELAKTRAELAEAEANLADAPPESFLTKLLGGDAEGLGALGAASTAVKAIPFVGASAGAVFQVIQDREDHESWTHSLVDGVVSNGASLVAGGAVAAGAAGVVAGVIGGSSFVAVGAGAVAGGFAAIGVGDVVHNVIQENWPADFHQHGVLGGLGHGMVDSLDKTRHDMAHYGDDIKNLF